MVGFSSIAILHPETILGATVSHLVSINSVMVQGTIKSNKDIPVTWEIPRVERIPFRNQGQRPILYYTVGVLKKQQQQKKTTVCSKKR